VAEEKPREENGVSNRQLPTTFIPPLTKVHPREYLIGIVTLLQAALTGLCLLGREQLQKTYPGWGLFLISIKKNGGGVETKRFKQRNTPLIPETRELHSLQLAIPMEKWRLICKTRTKGAAILQINTEIPGTGQKPTPLFKKAIKTIHPKGPGGRGELTGIKNKELPIF